MRSLSKWTLWLALVAGLVAVSEVRGTPKVSVHSRTGLYLLAQYKLAVGDTGSGLELLNRAMAARDSSLCARTP